MSDDLLNAAVSLLTLAIPIVLAAILPPVRQYLQAKIAAVQHEQLRAWIANMVLAAEQQFAGVGSDEAKLEYVTEHAHAFALQLGLNLTRAQVRALIEAAVKVELNPNPAQVINFVAPDSGGPV